MTDTLRQIQAHLSRLGFQPGALDGQAGPRTAAALQAAGLADDNLDEALDALAARVQVQRSQIPVLTVAELLEFAPDARPDWIGPLNMALVEAHITDARLPFFLAQLAHESGGLRYAEEIGGDRRPYTPYHGRGPIQLTHERNYRAAGAYLGLDLGGNPNHVESPWVGWACAAWYWLNTNLNRHIDADDFEALTRAINGGTNGLADRRRWLERARSRFPTGGGLTRRRPRLRS